jgi:quercetin dioxygenase-like cupin family protein
MRSSRFLVLLVLLLETSLALASSIVLQAQKTEESAVEKHLASAEFVHMPGTPDCFLAALEHGQPEKEASVMLMKGTAGCAVPWHWHISNEQIMMLRGTAQTQVRGDKVVLLRAGDYFFVPPHHVMRFACDSPCTLFVYTDGRFEIHYVDQNGKEIPSAEALKSVEKEMKSPKPR